MPEISLKPLLNTVRFPDPPGFGCSCAVAGWCQTFQRAQTEAERTICNGERLTPEQQAKYRSLWRKLADEATPEKIEKAKEVAARRQLMINERLAGPEVWPCVYRGDVLRQEPCEACGSSGRKENIFACQLHAECALRGYKTHGAEVKICFRCKDRKEPSEDEVAMDTPAAKSDQAEQPGPIAKASDQIIEIHPEPYPVDPLVVFDRWGRQVDSLRDLWRGSAGFLVCGGPSLKTLPLERLRDRGIVSLGINNACGYAPVRAATWSDPTEKFHHGISLDPSIMKFVPQPRLSDAVAVKLPSGEFAWTDMQLVDCPNVWAYNRSCEWEPERFLTSDAATWGNNDEGVKRNGRPKIIFTFFLGLRLLHYLGCRRIYLLGADFAMGTSDSGSGYAFNEARDDGAAKCNNDHYKRAAVMLKELKPILDKGGLEIFNCNRTSALDVFPHVSFAKAYADCRGNVPGEPFDLNGWYAKTLAKAGKAGRKAAKKASDVRRDGPNPHGKKQQQKINPTDPASKVEAAQAAIDARKAAGEKATREEEQRLRAAKRDARAARIARRNARIARRKAKAERAAEDESSSMESSVTSWSSTSLPSCGHEGPGETPGERANRLAKRRARIARRQAKAAAQAAGAGQ